MTNRATQETTFAVTFTISPRLSTPFSSTKGADHGHRERDVSLNVSQAQPSPTPDRPAPAGELGRVAPRLAERLDRILAEDRTVHDGIHPLARGHDRVGIGDVAIGMDRGVHLVARRRHGLGKIAAQLTVPAGEKDPHGAGATSAGRDL